MKKILIVVLLFNFMTSYSQNEASYDQSSIVKEGQNSPSFKYIVNSENKSSSDFKGKVVLINFFATWCGACMKEMPFLEKDIWNKLKDNKDFLIVSFGREHSQKEIDKFIVNKGFTFPIIADAEKTVYNLFATKFIPRNYLLDKSGKIVYSSVGFSTDEFEKLKEKINTLLIE